MNFFKSTLSLLSFLMICQSSFSDEPQNHSDKVKSSLTDSKEVKCLVRFESLADVTSSKQLWFQTNIGVGFLYFSGLKGNLMGKPYSNFSTSGLIRDVPLKGKLSYNRTPLFEYLLGYRYNSWLKLALSYQAQSGVTVQTKFLETFDINEFDGKRALFTSSLNLNALLLKFYFELPWALICKQVATSPYLAFGVGPGWQSWTRIRVDYMEGLITYIGSPLYLRQKISANAVWMIDAGLRMQSIRPNSPFSIQLGCKYNEWGQARSMGQMSEQDSYKLSLNDPVSIKTVYQFAPYLGLQWNFPNSYPDKPSYQVKGKTTNTWLPYFSGICFNEKTANFWTQFNVGVGFLYFSGVEGNIMGRPVENFKPSIFFRDVPLKGRLIYNKTPLFEYLLGCRFNTWLKGALSYQTQGNVTIETKSLNTFPDTSEQLTQRSSFISNLNLNGLLLKLYVDFPWEMIFKNTATSPYLAFGVGPGWQSWTSSLGNFTYGNTSFVAQPLPIRQKISANAVWMIDAGFKVQSVYPGSLFSVRLGCKYNEWGQARNIGKMSQQGSYKLSFTQPFKIKTVYQFAPYLGVQWNFAHTYSGQSPYLINCKTVNTWCPFFARSHLLEKKNGFWSQFNVGVGFLYFAGLKGNLMGRPVSNFSPTLLFRDVPLKGRLSYNRTPLFEYLIGYRFNSWFKGALSYQTQSGVTVQTNMLDAYPNASSRSVGKVRLTSNLNLNGLMLKLYFELPWAMIFKSTATIPYLSVGVGPGWQSWTQNTGDYTFGLTLFASDPLPMRQKISANAIWMIDSGFKIQSAYPNSPFSLLIGCKYNEWGQARSIGKMSQQDSHKRSFTQPVSIKTVYQFAPYLGVQWNF